MIPELGHFALIIALSLAIVQAIFPMIGAQRGNVAWMQLARPAAVGQFIFTGIAFLCLVNVFLNDDFSVLYAAMNSNTQTPTIYKISAVWGAHEGSLLLWAWILTIWAASVAVFSRSIPLQMAARVLSVLGLISIGFMLFMLITSNPFERLVPVPPQGRDLNPLLQDPGLAIHPPMLYMGYVGLAVPFAFAIAAMLSGRLDAAWARWSRPWTVVAWMFLSLGIALGSWWAYYELGWGGWWFWDPVENASFMPWLAATALIHSLAVTEKRGSFKSWTVLLAIFAFSLSLLGTFLVRSGVLTSVHSFASDPERGVAILIFLLAVVGGSLLLYTFRAAEVKSDITYAPVSREVALLVNNAVLTVFAAFVLLATLAPVIVDFFIWLGLVNDKISVGPSFYNFFFRIFGPMLAVAVGLGVLLRWKKDDLARLKPWIIKAGLGSVIGGAFIVLAFLPQWFFLAFLGVALALWMTLATLKSIQERLAGGRSITSVPLGFWGMTMGHLGIVVFTLGVTITALYSTEKDVRLAPGETYALKDYSFRFDGVKELAGPNYQAARGEVVILKGDAQIALLHPEKRIYNAQPQPMTEAGIDAGLFRDLFVALGEPLGNEGAWALRLYHKPYVRWIWLGAIFMGIGGILSASDRRYRTMAKRAAKLPSGTEAA